MKKSKINEISRRDFCKFAALAASSVLAAKQLRADDKTALGDQKGKPIFSFVQLTDSHISPFPTYAKANEKIEWLVESINQEKNFPMPDFMFITGDIINGAKQREHYKEDFKLAKKILSALKCPYYTVIGNHENYSNENNPDFQGDYEEAFGKDRVSYHFVHKGMLFVCLNSSNGFGDSKPVGLEGKRKDWYEYNIKTYPQTAEIIQRRNEWLKTTLQKYPKLPKIIACHIPMVYLRDVPVMEKSFGFPSATMIGDGTWDIIRAEKETVVAVIHGHLHMTGVVVRDNIYHISPSGTASYPCHYAHYSVYEDHIDVQMLQVPKELITPETNIHGKPRYDHGFTDSTHPTEEEYVSGTKTEQCLAIPLSGGKKIFSI